LIFSFKAFQDKIIKGIVKEFLFFLLFLGDGGGDHGVDSDIDVEMVVFGLAVHLFVKFN